MRVKYRPKAPRGTHWEGDVLVGDSGYLEMSHEVLLALQAQVELEDGAPVVDGKVRATFWVPVEEVPDGNFSQMFDAVVGENEDDDPLVSLARESVEVVDVATAIVVPGKLVADILFAEDDE